jgi:hypothetical protein
VAARDLAFHGWALPGYHRRVPPPIRFASPRVRALDAVAIAVSVLVLGWLFYVNARLASSVIDGTRYFWLDDDMMISMRYGRNLAEGHGLVWNAGERVEGYTNFLWTLVMAAVHLFPIPDAKTALAVKAIGFLFMAGSFYLATRLLRRFVPRSLLAAPVLLTCMVLCVDIVHWSVWGFEASLITFLNLLFLVRVVEGKDDWLCFLALSLIPITRSDCAYLFAANAVVAWWLSERKERTLGYLAAALVPFVLHLAFRRVYYGDWLPNTYYLKVYKLDAVRQRGLMYMRNFLLTYSILVTLAAGSALAIAEKDRRAVVFFATVPMTLGYVIFTGGDMFFEFRFFAHVMPVIFVFATAGIDAVAKTKVAKPIWACVLLLISVPLLGPFDRLIVNDTNGDPKEQIRVAMLVKKNALPGSSVAVITAGILPYFTRLRTVDVLGKSDRHVARLTPFPGSMVGHGKLDPAYTLGLKPDLVVSCRSFDFAYSLTTDARTTDVVASFLASRVFQEEYRPHPIREPFLLEKTAVYTYEGSPESARRVWKSVEVSP